MRATTAPALGLAFTITLSAVCCSDPDPAEPPRAPRDAATMASAAPIPTPPAPTKSATSTPSVEAEEKEQDQAEATSSVFDKQSFFSAPVKNSLEYTIVKEVGSEHGPALTQVVKRILVWELRPDRDLRRGDLLEVVYTLKRDEEPIVDAVWFQSEKLGRTITAIRYRAKGDDFHRYYRPDGSEVEERLVDGPLEEYEQITSLLRDGRRHRGVDFKAPVGTTLYAPFSGRVVRKNWAMRGNGVSLDILTDKGFNALFLHLDTIAKDVKQGARVKKGQVLGTTGNTGRSTAPHLHYQLQRGERRKILDPFDVHKTTRRHLPKEDIPSLTQLLDHLGKAKDS